MDDVRDLEGDNRDFDECVRCRRPAPDFDALDGVRRWPAVNDSAGRIVGWTCLGCMTAAEHAIRSAEIAGWSADRRAA